MPDRFEDARGVILDLLTGPIDGVTEIWTRAGAIRGNHVHEHTTQWVYVVSGRLLTVWDDADGIHAKVWGPHELLEEGPGIPHAWKALEDTVVLVITRGPRSGADYESDTRRLEVPILT